MQDQPSTNFSRVIGTETEFGIAAKDAALSDPVAGSIAVIGHYPGLPAPNAIWDYENENPLLDARGFEVEGERERPNPEYNRQLNKVLANGGRLYVDGAGTVRLRNRFWAINSGSPVASISNFFFPTSF